SLQFHCLIVRKIETTFHGRALVGKKKKPCTEANRVAIEYRNLERTSLLMQKDPRTNSPKLDLIAHDITSAKKIIDRIFANALRIYDQSEIVGYSSKHFCCFEGFRFPYCSAGG